MAEVDGYRVFAGLRSDPFFIDVLGTMDNFKFTGSDFFADKDVHAIVLELPNTALGSADQVGLWARTMLPADDPATRMGRPASWMQADRAALAEQANFFLNGEAKEAYVAAQPAHDSEQFVEAFAHALEHAGQRPPEDARRVAQSLLPEILPYDARRPAQYPHSGRTLTDDVYDRFLGILTNGQVTTDNVGPHKDLLPEFPYLGAPHST